MIDQQFSITVPATTANLGPGFDSVGIALSAYMTVDVIPHDRWKVAYKEAVFQQLATDETNLIVHTAIEVAKRYHKILPPQRLSITSSIPFGKGFGSSASAIAAGIMLADTVLSIGMTHAEKVKLGAHYEGHVDNVSAALLGGIVVNYMDQEAAYYIRVQEADTKFIALIPPEILTTTASRGLLPNHISHGEAVQSSTANGVLTAALMQNNWQLVGEMMAKDLLHERYRKEIMPDFEGVRTYCRQLGAYGMTISGAGPSLLVAVAPGTEEEIAAKLVERYPYYQAQIMSLSTKGATIQYQTMDSLS